MYSSFKITQQSYPVTHDELKAGIHEGACSLQHAPSWVLKFALRERVSGASSLVCTCWGTYPGARFESVLEEQAPSCVLVGVLTRERVSGACFRSKLPRVYRPLGKTERVAMPDASDPFLTPNY